MMYWIIVAVLVILILITTVFTIKGIRREHNERREEKLMNRAAASKRKSAEEQIHRNKNKGKAATAGNVQKKPEKKPVPKKKRRWKIILENMSTGEIYEYIFYHAVGIGRTDQEVSFEEFLSLPEDKRISKVHCSILMYQDNLCLKDEGSKNHTYLNGKKIQKPVVLQKEDVISIGETDLVVVKIFREAK